MRLPFARQIGPFSLRFKCIKDQIVLVHELCVKIKKASS